MDQSCCRREPKCGVDPHTCDYYGPSKLTKDEVHLGGIYEPHSPQEPKKSLDLVPEEKTVDDGGGGASEAMAKERSRQCEMVMKKWSTEFLKKTPLAPFGPCCGDAKIMAKNKIKDIEKVQNVTERIMEKFGGLTLGFSGRGKISGTSTGPQDPYNYQGPKGQLFTPKVPEYPNDLRMKMVCGYGKGRQNSSFPRRPRRAWEVGYRPDSSSLAASFTPSFQSSRSSTRTKRKSGVKGQGDEEEEGEEEEEEFASSRRMTDNDLKEEIPPSADDVILEYVEKYNLEIMFEYFLALCCLHTPENPYQFISDLANRMMEARDSDESFSSLERIFHAEHVSAVFRMFDKEQNGFVTLKQYKTAMEVLGLVKYNLEPDGHDSDKVTEDTFVTEGTAALDDLLRSFLYVEAQDNFNN